jgi:hypothetical protein
MCRLELVVAHCREDLSWLRKVPAAFRVTVYSKGGDAVPAAPLPNVGREAHTYLHHIVDRYESLAARTVFAQGRPFDHVPELRRILRDMAGGRAQAEGFQWLGFVVDWDDRTGSRLFRTWSKNTDRRPLDMARFWRTLWDEPVPERFTFYPGAHFVVTAELVRRRARAFYERARTTAAALPDAAHCFERCWDRVFGVDGIPPALRHRPLPLYLRPVRRLGLTWQSVTPNTS